MEQEVRELAAARQELAQCEEIIGYAEEQLRQQYADEYDRLAEAKKRVKEADAKVREKAEEEYNRTGAKKLTGGVGIRVSTTIVYDEKTAYEWAMSKEMFLKLDKKAFEKAAPGLGLPFVEQKDKVTVTVPKEVKIDE